MTIVTIPTVVQFLQTYASYLLQDYVSAKVNHMIEFIRSFSHALSNITHPKKLKVDSISFFLGFCRFWFRSCFNLKFTLHQFFFVESLY